MIDFPASPVDGQTFNAPNGVIYRWSATYTSWLAQAAPPVMGGTGDVSAYNGSAVQSNGTAQVITFAGATVIGNSGAWLNLATGRYTPPAGRYHISCSMSTQAPTGGNGTWTLDIRKNGVIVAGNSGSGAASFAIPITFGMDVDANGVDYFDFVSVQQAAGMNSQGNAVFTAFPLTGMQGPDGNPGPPNPVVGDFAAAGNPALGTGGGSMIMPTINGNAGNYYNTSTGRWTPPAGRYNVYGTIAAWSSAGGVGITSAIRKNGTNLLSIAVNSPGANQWGSCPIETQVDANGTDYFDLWGASNPGATGSNAYFGAYPIQGMVGQQGPNGNPGSLQAVSLFWSVANGAFTTAAGNFTFDTVGENTAGGSYASGIYTIGPGMGGLYDVNATIQGSSSGGFGFIYLMKSGVQIANAGSYVGASGSSISLNGKFRFAAGDQISINHACTVSGGSIYGTNGGARNSWMMLSRLGA